MQKNKEKKFKLFEFCDKCLGFLGVGLMHVRAIRIPTCHLCSDQLRIFSVIVFYHVVAKKKKDWEWEWEVF